MKKLIKFNFCFLILLSVFFYAQWNNGARAEDKILRILMLDSDIPGLSNLGNTFDPNSFVVMTKVLDTLVIYSDEKKKLVPHLAVSWKLKDSKEIFKKNAELVKKYKNQIWDIKLREGVKFHNGEEFDADTVVYNFNRILDPKTIGTSKESGVFFVYSGIEKIEKIDKFTVRFFLKYPDGMFINRFNLFSAMNAPKALETMGFEKFIESPVGTGPFMFESYTKGKEIVFKKNPNYWIKGLPKVDKIIFKIINPDNWIKEVQNGEIDLALTLPGKKIESNLNGLIKEGKLKHTVCADARNSYWLILSEMGPLKDVRVRQAINYALDKKHMLNYLEKDIGNIMATTSFPGEVGHDKKIVPYPFDLDKAKKLLKEAENDLKKDGMEIANGFSIKIATYPQGAPLANYVTFQLKKIGITLEVDTLPYDKFMGEIPGHKMANGKPNPKYHGYIHYTDSPLDHYGFTGGWQFFSKSPWAMINIKEIDQTYLSGLSETDPKQHASKMEIFDQVIKKYAPAVFTYNKALNLVYSSKVDIGKYCPITGISNDFITKIEMK